MDVVKAASAAGLLLLVAGPDVIRIAPSLVISLTKFSRGCRASSSRSTAR
jgi:acetylornithine/succinyldiaminopimelate/putrescine aminotransferase